MVQLLPMVKKVTVALVVFCGITFVMSYGYLKYDNAKFISVPIALRPYLSNISNPFGKILKFDVWGIAGMSRDRDILNLHNGPVIKMSPRLPSPILTHEQMTMLDKLTEPDLSYQHIRSQRLPITNGNSKLLPESETIPVKVDWARIENHLNKTWYANYHKTNGTYNSRFNSTMTLKQRVLMMGVLDAFIQACDWANVTYFLCGGSMLGSYRHQGFIPWDDDIDIAVKASHWKKLHYALSRITGFTIYARSADMWKMYFTNSPKILNYPYKWPCLDVFFYGENVTHLWGTTRILDHQLMERKSEVFPLRYRPFEHIWAKIPCNAPMQLLRRFKIDNCMSLWWNHKKEWGLKSYTIPCNDLHHAFPFVFRSSDGEGNIVETLKIGNITLQTFKSKPFCDHL